MTYRQKRRFWLEIFRFLVLVGGYVLLSWGWRDNNLLWLPGAFLIGIWGGLQYKRGYEDGKDE